MRLTFKTGSTEVDYEGTEEFLSDHLLTVIDRLGQISGRLNLDRVKADVVDAVRHLESVLLSLEQSHGRVVELQGELGALVATLETAARTCVEELQDEMRSASPSAAEAIREVQKMQEMNMSFNMQYLQLQQKMQDERRRFTLLANVMKTKHDTVKNSIQNVR
jgi:hypothetical protein